MTPATRWVASGLILALALLAGLVKGCSEDAPASRLEHQQRMQQAELKQRFDQAVVMLHAKQYEHAVTALHRVLELAPRLPEAHANMGFALLGLQQPAAARGFFDAALALNPRQANAYYGLALIEEQQGDFAAALGAMRSYLHFTPAADPHVARARAALWEWEARLGR
jgi:tetratricopeptide (TPR) repeat protein